MRMLLPSLVLMLAFAGWGTQAQANCSAHAEYLTQIPDQLTEKLDVCQWYVGDDYAETIFNFGTKPEWIDNQSFVFIDNNVGNVFHYDMTTQVLTSLSDHFDHSGFNRVHKLANNDLLLVGTLGGAIPDDFHPLVPFEENMFVGEMSVLRYPYTGQPQPLGEKGWEGIAVAKNSMNIAFAQNPNEFYYSEDQDYACNTVVGGFVRSVVTGIGQFFAGALSIFGINLDPNFVMYGINNLCHYAVSDGKLFVAEIAYDSNGTAYLAGKKLLVHKYSTRNGFFLPYIVSSLEAQNFVGEFEDKVSYTSYGPLDFVGTPNIVDINTREFTKLDDVYRYAEWEGVHPDLQHSVMEIDPKADPFTLGHVHNFLSDIPAHWGNATGDRLKNLTPLPHRYNHELVFSPDGTKLLGTATANLGYEGWEPGYGNAIIIHDYHRERSDHPERYEARVSPMVLGEPLRQIMSYQHNGLCLERVFDFWDWTDWFGGFDNVTWSPCDSGRRSQKWYYAEEKEVYQSAEDHLIPQCMGALDKPYWIFWTRTDLDSIACWRNEAKRVKFDGATIKDAWTGKGLYSAHGSAGFEWWGPGLSVQAEPELLY